MTRAGRHEVVLARGDLAGVPTALHVHEPSTRDALVEWFGRRMWDGGGI